MPAHLPLFHAVADQLTRCTATQHLRKTSVERLALLVTGIMAARSCVLAQVAAELDVLKLSAASRVESIERRLGRTLNDAALTPGSYTAALAQVIEWEALRQPGQHAVVIIDESTKRDQVHLLRVSLAYRGRSITLTWAIWRQNVKQPDGHYWRQVDLVLTRLAAILPAGVAVVVVADRAYDIAPFIDRLTARGWHWIVRCKANGSGRFLDAQGQEWELRALVRQQLTKPGTRWKTQGSCFKDAGWRAVRVVAIWESGQEEPLVLLTDLEARWEVLRIYGERFWTEPAFRQDKSKGWHWEDCQVRRLPHHRRLLLAMAWASLLTLFLGCVAATEELARLRQRRPPRRPRHATLSLFALGLRAIRRHIHHRTAPPLFARPLPPPTGLSWNDEWLCAQCCLHFFKTVRS